MERAYPAVPSGGDGASIEDPTPVLTVFVDANEAAATGGEAGATVLGGPRVGEAAIEAILYDGIIEVTARTPKAFVSTT